MGAAHTQNIGQEHRTASHSQIEAHLQAQYDAGEKRIYVEGRSSHATRIVVRYEFGTSRYNNKNDEIMIFISDGNVEDFDRHLGKIRTNPDKWQLCVSEIELLHEMIHERQFKETPVVTNSGRALHARFLGHFDGPGHDELFFTAVDATAKALGVSSEELVKNI